MCSEARRGDCLNGATCVLVPTGPSSDALDIITGGGGGGKSVSNGSIYSPHHDVEKPGFHCICPPGWMGPRCNEAVSECQTRQPCQHGATCHDEGNGRYQCLCEDGFIGKSRRGEAADKV
ncbi:unnamed protein product [Protopolystoma xenopodis]|uniref:EGF-like domain-containing protein n=1 Tax=Protopolystoma xenopodis TaxID=117903 RepID=A0A448X3U8_9PLAT|nr:unnamed protein product [Protopolystoma xenopodis]